MKYWCYNGDIRQMRASSQLRMIGNQYIALIDILTPILDLVTHCINVTLSYIKLHMVASMVLYGNNVQNKRASPASDMAPKCT
jgi:hypothetical protein